MITIENYEIYAIDYLENNLSPAERADFEKLMSQNPSLRAEMAALSDNWDDLALQPDEAVVFADKAALLQTAPSRPLAAAWWTGYARVAAALAGVALVVGLLMYNLPNENANIADNNIENNTKNEIENNTKNMGQNTEDTTIEPEKSTTIIAPNSVEKTVNQSIQIAKVDKTKDIPNQKVINKIINNGKKNVDNFESIKKMDIQNQNNLAVSNNQNNSQNTTNQQDINKNNNDILKNSTKNKEAENEHRIEIAAVEPLQTKNVNLLNIENNNEIMPLNIDAQIINSRIKSTANTQENIATKIWKTLVPEATVQRIERKEKPQFWKTFLPESAQDVDMANVTESLRPSR